MSHGWFQTAPFDWDAEAGVLRRAEAFGDGPVTLEMRDAPGGVRWPPRAPRRGGRDAAAARVGRMLQLDADLTGFPKAVAAVDDDLAPTSPGTGRAACSPGPRSTRTS